MLKTDCRNDVEFLDEISIHSISQVSVKYQLQNILIYFVNMTCSSLRQDWVCDASYVQPFLNLCVNKVKWKVWALVYYSQSTADSPGLLID